MSEKAFKKIDVEVDLVLKFKFMCPHCYSLNVHHVNDDERETFIGWLLECDNCEEILEIEEEYIYFRS